MADKGVRSKPPFSQSSFSDKHIHVQTVRVMFIHVSTSHSDRLLRSFFLIFHQTQYVNNVTFFYCLEILPLSNNIHCTIVMIFGIVYVNDLYN